MKKKPAALMAAVALAISFSVSARSAIQIYGKARVAYLHADSGTGRNSGDMLFNPGGSKIGFKGTEDLGDGNAAWFQLEETFPLDGEDASWTSRNTGVGLKGNWGLFGVGQWDTPYKRIGGGSDTWQGIGDTGIGGVDAIISNRDTTAGNGTHNSYAFARRHKGLLWYNSPDLGGFRFSGAFSDNRGDDAVGGVNTPDSATGNPRLYSLSASYDNGPLAIGLGYEKHRDFVRSGSSDDAWTLSGAYRFTQVFRIGLNYEHLKYSDDIAAGSGDTKRNSWAVFADWHVGGPHSLHAAYVKADDTSGSQIATLGSVVGNDGAGGTGAALWALQYGYAFSKRTSMALTYARLNNDDSANYFQYGAAANPGRDQTVYGLTMSHVF